MRREIDVTIRLFWRPQDLRPFMVAGLMLFCAGELGSESVTLTTYYPAPSGIYTRMITTSQTDLVRDGGDLTVGASAPANVTVRGNVGMTTGSLTISAGNASINSGNLTVGTAAPNVVRIQASNGRLGVGTLAPTVPLHVVGGVRVDGPLRIIASGCVGVDVTQGPVCGPGRYATFTPGFNIEGWSYQNRGGAVVAKALSGQQTNQVWALHPSGNAAWMTLQKDDSSARIWCCPNS